MATLYLVRHGETQFNRELMFRGRTEVPLNRRGRGQAKLAAEALAKKKVARVFTSPLARAQQTAKPIADKLSLPYMQLEALTDMDFGSWTGLSLEEVGERFPKELEGWKNEPARANIPGGETLAEVQERVMPAVLEELASADEGVVLVTHRVVLKTVICGLLGWGEAGFWRFRIDTGSLSIFENTTRGARCTLLNDTSHLRRLHLPAGADF